MMPMTVVGIILIDSVLVPSWMHISLSQFPRPSFPCGKDRVAPAALLVMHQSMTGVL